MKHVALRILLGAVVLAALCGVVWFVMHNQNAISIAVVVSWLLWLAYMTGDLLIDLWRFFRRRVAA